MGKFKNIFNSVIVIVMCAELGLAVIREVRYFNEARKITSGENCIPWGDNVAFYRQGNGALGITTWADSKPGSYGLAANEVDSAQVDGLGVRLGTQRCKEK
ncbi:hypothetical protein IPJ91_01320 [bacterium]|nr:MAG: hypothetical protein IPJ91_01320 [bacterium]